MLDVMHENGTNVVAIGKIQDLFSGRGIDKPIHTNGNANGIEKTIEEINKDTKGLIFTNLVDTDMLYGHRNNIEGYARALEYFDSKLPEIMSKMVDVFEHICWKDNLMLLNDRKVGEVLNRLSRYYGRTILFGKEIGEIPISGQLDLRENLEEVVEIICQSLFLRQERDGENNIILLK